MNATPRAVDNAFAWRGSLIALGLVLVGVTLALAPGQLVDWQGASTHDPHPRALVHLSLAVPDLQNDQDQAGKSASAAPDR